MRDTDRRPDEPRFRARERGRDRGRRDPRERPYARDRERRTEFRGPEFVEDAGYASRYPARRPDSREADFANEPFEGFGEQRPHEHPGHGRSARFGSEAGGYGRERMDVGDDAERIDRSYREHERRRRDHEGIGEYSRGGGGDRERARGYDEPQQRTEGRPERAPHSYEEQHGAPSSGGARSFGGFGGFDSGGYAERSTGEERAWPADDRGGIGFSRQGRGTAHPGSSRWVEGGRWDEETESVSEDYSRHPQPYGGRPSGRIDEWARGTSERPSGGYAGRGPRSYRRSDERIREDICERLTRDPDIDATEIDIEVSDGGVTLSGRVESREMRDRAEDIAQDCWGVRDVRNDLRVAPAAD